MWLLILLFLSGIANADVYVITDQNNNVYSLSESNDAIIPNGYNLTILKGKNISSLPIAGDPTLYIFSNGAFTLNSSKVQTQQAAQTTAIAQQTSMAQAKSSALAKIQDALNKSNPADVLTNQEIQAVTGQ